ncbi:hypothetical protein KSS87_021755 [Heliosperma pusillum]|nr:hypothetical protein KSS87_021755 [Heliosperma pusillum]
MVTKASASSSLKEYLKKYENNENEEKKRKKKKPKTVATGVLVVDEDPVWQKPVNLEEEEEDEPEGEPQVHEDVNVKFMKRMELLKAKGSYNQISEDGSGWVSVTETAKCSDSVKAMSDSSPPRNKKARFDTPSPEAGKKPSDSSKGDSDLSPPRQGRRRNDSPSPTRSGGSGGGDAADLSPPRQRRRANRSPSPQLNSKSKSLKDSIVDLSPPRKHGRRYDSPSPEPNNALDAGYNSDLSPPRRQGRSQISHPTATARKMLVSNADDLSPPRRAHPFKSSDSRGSEDLSPPRKGRKGSDKINTRDNISQQISKEDLSPPRKKTAEKKTGLITGKDVREEIAKIKKDEWSRFKEMDASASGQGAEPVYRFKGERVSKDEYLKLTKKQEKPKVDKKLEWGKGLAQKREAEAELHDLELEKAKPFARSRDDPELDTMMKDRLRWGDPMAHLVKRKQSDLMLPDFGDSESMKESGFIVPQEIPSHSWLKRRLDFEPNRYGIKPGRHWDGVNRSNGYEKQLFKRTSEKKATELEAYLWSRWEVDGGGGGLTFGIWGGKVVEAALGRQMVAEAVGMVVGEAAGMVMPAVWSLKYLARKIPIKLNRHVLYHSTTLKLEPKFSVPRRWNLSNNDAQLLDCLVNGDLHNARRLLYEMPQTGHSSKVVTWTSLLSKFAKEGLVDEAQLLFDILPDRNIVTCNAMLSGYVRFGRLIEACGFFEAMQEKNVVSWTSMLRGLMNAGKLEEAKALFEDMPERNVVSWNTMIAGLVKNGDLAGARSAFDSMPTCDLVSWNTMIDGYVESCMMEEGKALFDQMEDANVITWTTLISGYCRDEDVWTAYELFRSMPAKNVVSWTAMIGGYTWNGYFEEAISLFREMKGETDVKPNVETFISLAYACAGVGFPHLCMQLHAHLVTNCSSYHDHDGRLSLALIFMYAKCGLMEYAKSIFLKNSMTKTSQYGNVMINGYVQKGQLEKAKHIFDLMAVRDKISWTSIITGYFNVNEVAEACKLFNSMPETERDAIAWTAMISGFVQNELFQEAMHLLSEMLLQGIMPLKATCSTLLGVAGATAQLDVGRHLHSLVIKTYSNFDPILENSLISMYAKCGEISDAFRIFSNMTWKDSISWNSIIVGFSHHGLAREALSLFGYMIKLRIKPNSVTFLGILSACNHEGLVDEGWAVYRAMSDAYGILPEIEHNICMINLIGRAGKIEEAENFVLSLPFNQDIAIWGALLGVCGVGEGNYEVASRTSQRLLELDPVNAAGHVVLCNMTASVGQYGEEGMLRKEMRSKGVRKAPGFSWVSSGEGTHMFLSGDVAPI